MYNKMVKFSIPMKVLRLTKTLLTETCNRVLVGYNLSGMFPVRNSVKGDALSPLLFNYALEYAISRVQVS